MAHAIILRTSLHHSMPHDCLDASKAPCYANREKESFVLVNKCPEASQDRTRPSFLRGRRDIRRQGRVAPR